MVIGVKSLQKSAQKSVANSTKLNSTKCTIV